MKSDIRQPCASCPYRKDAPLKLWDRSEFENLLAQDADAMRGRVFGCHQYGKRPEAEHRYCVGWLLDQIRRERPSIRLRMRLISDPELGPAMDAMTDGGHELYASIEAMCAANGVRVARAKQSLIGGVQEGTTNELTVWSTAAGAVEIRGADQRRVSSLSPEQLMQFVRLLRDPPIRNTEAGGLLVRKVADLIQIRDSQGNLLTCLGGRAGAEMARLLLRAQQEGAKDDA